MWELWKIENWPLNLKVSRKTRTGTDGSKPKRTGEDNGLNAWMDVALNQTDQHVRIDANYAKNLDNNHFYDTDDVPIRGPLEPDTIYHRASSWRRQPWLICSWMKIIFIFAVIWWQKATPVQQKPTNNSFYPKTEDHGNVMTSHA